MKDPIYYATRQRAQAIVDSCNEIMSKIYKPQNNPPPIAEVVLNKDRNYEVRTYRPGLGESMSEQAELEPQRLLRRQLEIGKKWSKFPQNQLVNNPEYLEWQQDLEILRSLIDQKE